jgi:hypothetical protein
MTPRRLLRDAADTAMALKETYTADNGISQVRPTLMAYDDKGRRVVAVLMNSAALADIGMAAFALTATWQPSALAFVTEGYVRHYDGEGLGEPQESVCVAVHARGHPSVSLAMPFTYLTDHVVVWGEEGEVGTDTGYGGELVEILDSAIQVEPMPGIPLAGARSECADWLRERGDVVVT